jgi:hypothetical protein
MLSHPRQTGRTTKLLLDLMQQMLNGKKVLVVLAHPSMIPHLQKKLNDLFQFMLPLEPIGNASSTASHVTAFQLTGGSAFFTADIFASRLYGMRFDNYLSDPGDLDAHELTQVARFLNIPPAPLPPTSGSSVTKTSTKKVFKSR